MSNMRVAMGAVLGAILVVCAYGLYRAGVSAGRSDAVEAGTAEPETAQQVLYWHDPMVPGQRFDKPGKSPFMDMELVPVYAESGDGGGTTIDARVQQNLGIRVVEVTRGELRAGVTVVGSVDYNERDAAVVQARADGFIERLVVRAALDRVSRGQPLAELYVPAWVAAQEEYLSVKGLQSAELIPAMLEGARQRMRLTGMTSEQIASVEATGTVQSRLMITAPIDGVITELAAREGMTVTVGTPLFRINGLSTVWVNAAIPESLAAQVQRGQRVEARTPSLPGAVFTGEVSALLPEVDAATRTLKARVELANGDNRLNPGMFATLRFSEDQGRDALLVPSEAVIQTGTRTVVMLAEEEGRFKPVDVEIGLENEGLTEIRSGLTAGQKVVVSGQFLVDSEASLKATESRLTNPGMTDRGTTP